jgi:hypothetical protein
MSGFVEGGFHNVNVFGAVRLWPPTGTLAAGSIPELRPPDGLLGPSFWEEHQRDVALGILAMIGVCVLLGLRWRRPRLHPAAPIPPETAAREELLAQRGRTEDATLASDVSQIVRRYVAVAFALPEGEQTSEELVAALGAHPIGGRTAAAALDGLLRQCDEKKFAPNGAGPPADLVNRAIELVEKLEARRAPAAAPGTSDQPSVSAAPSA